MSRICSFLSSAVSSAVVKAEDAQGWTKEEECVCVGGETGAADSWQLTISRP